MYFRDLFHAIYLFSLDRHEFLAKCEKIVDKKFDFQELVRITYDDIQLCDIVIEQQQFQNLKNLDRVFSTIMKDHFFENLNNREFQIKQHSDGTILDSFYLESDWLRN